MCCKSLLFLHLFWWQCHHFDIRKRMRLTCIFENDGEKSCKNWLENEFCILPPPWAIQRSRWTGCRCVQCNRRHREVLSLSAEVSWGSAASPRPDPSPLIFPTSLPAIALRHKVFFSSLNHSSSPVFLSSSRASCTSQRQIVFYLDFPRGVKGGLKTRLCCEWQLERYSKMDKTWFLPSLLRHSPE